MQRQCKDKAWPEGIGKGEGGQSLARQLMRFMETIKGQINEAGFNRDHIVESMLSSNSFRGLTEGEFKVHV